ncbi:hypothetical protein [Algoriphagus antarcticus]|uniref:Outer membrane beta-barrel porin/alpha-amylase n=1 Tax=Algoriphagus antarcticus TaxID=238540 RepID=A0A3E0E0V9_9BACT|nr:hypothetical protein [Algoriphagus antarcticus]REG90536.1 hypothetical protein C8N25_10634 [Algoriphagus antarcticus]
MKRFTLLTGIAMLFCQLAMAQEIENKPFGSYLEKLDEDFPVTDTLVFDFPNEGKLLLLFNKTAYELSDLKEKFGPVLKKTTKFPEFKTLVYRLSEEYPQTKIDAVILDLERDYLPYVDQLELSAVIGMDYTGGEFTPEVGARIMFNFRKFDIGASFTNKVFFPERIEGNIKVNSNWFANLEYRWDRSDPKSNSANMVGVGLLVNDSKSLLFSGTTMQAFYKRAVNKNISIQVGVISTENFRTFYPTVGIRFW